MTSSDRCRSYYTTKTEAIIQRYCPGHRIHYHCGIIDSSPPSDSTQQSLRQIIWQSQERLLSYAAKIWRVAHIPFNNVLDVGCGLGGGAIFWAKEYGASVTAVSNVQSHIELVVQLARQASVAEQITAVLSDAAEVPGENRFDAAIAFESSCHFDRRPWFQRLRKLLRRNGKAFIADYFFANRPGVEIIDTHFCAQVGTLAEYESAARDANLSVLSVEDISVRTKYFWAASSALIRCEPPRIVDQKRERSARVHDLMQQLLGNGEMRYLLLTIT